MFLLTGAREHLQDIRLINTGSHLLKHVLDKHEGETLDEVDFWMKVVKFHKNSFEQQIHESVLIQASKPHFLLNSKMEYNRCQIPRISIKMGEKEIKEKKKDLEEEIAEREEREQKLETKIKTLKKLMNKKRAPRRPQQCEPGRKRIRIDPFGEIGIEIDGLRAKRDEIEDKNIRERKLEQMRRQEMLEHPPNKKMCKGDIRNYLSHKSTNLQPPP